MIKASISMAAFLLLIASAASARPVQFAIAPFLDEDMITETYQPLMDYLRKETGAEFEIVTTRNFISYWSRIRQKKLFDFVMDGSHLAGYRLERRGHTLVAKAKGVLSFSLITRSDKMVIDIDELTAKRIAVLPPPNIGGLKIYQMFPNPMRQPELVEVQNSQEAITAIKSERADAAYVPTPIVSSYSDAAVITVSDPLPNLTVTAAPHVPKDLIEKVRLALLRANLHEEGQKILQNAGLTDGFEPASPAEYKEAAALLRGMWGY